MCVCVRACVRACVCVCVRVCCARARARALRIIVTTNRIFRFINALLLLFSNTQFSIVQLQLFMLHNSVQLSGFNCSCSITRFNCPAVFMFDNSVQLSDFDQ